MQKEKDRGLKLVQLDKNTEIWVKPHIDPEKVRAKFNNRKKRGNWGYVYYGTIDTGNKRGGEY